MRLGAAACALVGITLPTWQAEQIGRRLGSWRRSGEAAQSLALPTSRLLLCESQPSPVPKPLLAGHLVACNPKPAKET